MSPTHIQAVAIADAEAAATWYEAQRPGLGVEFILQLDASIERAAQFPEGYALQYREARRVLMRRFPYAIYFVFENGAVEVFAVLHQHTDPSSWQLRTP